MAAVRRSAAVDDVIETPGVARVEWRHDLRTLDAAAPNLTSPLPMQLAMSGAWQFATLHSLLHTQRHSWPRFAGMFESNVGNPYRRRERRCPTLARSKDSACGL